MNYYCFVKHMPTGTWSCSEITKDRGHVLWLAASFAGRGLWRFHIIRHESEHMKDTFLFYLQNRDKRKELI